MSYDYYGVMEGTLIKGVLQVDSGAIVDSSMTTSLLVDWLTRPALPNVYHRYHLVSGSIVTIDPRTLSIAVINQLNKMRVAREVAINNTFVWSGSPFDADLTSRNRLLSLKVDSLDPAYVPRSWRLADNTWRTLSAADVAGVWAALRVHTEAQYTTFASLETDILSKTTVAQVVTVEWPV